MKQNAYKYNFMEAMTSYTFFGKWYCAKHYWFVWCFSKQVSWQKFPFNILNWIVIKCLFYVKTFTLTWWNYFQYFLHLCFECIQNIDIQHLYCKYTWLQSAWQRSSSWQQEKHKQMYVKSGEERYRGAPRQTNSKQRQKQTHVNVGKRKEWQKQFAGREKQEKVPPLTWR